MINDKEFFETKIWAFLRKRAKWLGYLIILSSIAGWHAHLITATGQLVVSKLKYELGIKPSKDKLLIFYHAYLAGRNIIGMKDIWKAWPPDQETALSYTEIQKNLSVLGYASADLLNYVALKSGDNIDRLTSLWAFRSNVEGFLIKQGGCLDCYFQLGASIKVLENEADRAAPSIQTLEIYSRDANKEWSKIRGASTFKIPSEVLFPLDPKTITAETIRSQLESAAKVIASTLNARA